MTEAPSDSEIHSPNQDELRHLPAHREDGADLPLTGLSYARRGRTPLLQSPHAATPPALLLGRRSGHDREAPAPGLA
jgi:hypothetical protein